MKTNLKWLGLGLSPLLGATVLCATGVAAQSKDAQAQNSASTSSSAPSSSAPSSTVPGSLAPGAASSADMGTPHRVVLNLPSHSDWKTHASFVMHIAAEGPPQMASLAKQDVNSATDTVITYDKTATGYRVTSHTLSQVAPASSAGQVGSGIQENSQVTGLVMSTDKGLAPISIDNIDALKAAITAAMGKLPATPATPVPMSSMGPKIVDAMFTGLSPEGAAQLFNESGNLYHVLYGQDFVLNQTVATANVPIRYQGASLSLNSHVTLTDWTEGKTASFTYDYAPTEADLRGFMESVASSFAGAIVPQDPQPGTKMPSRAQIKAIMVLVFERLSMNVKGSCKLQDDLSTGLIVQQNCQNTMQFVLDLPGLMHDLMPNQPTPANMTNVTFKMDMTTGAVMSEATPAAASAATVARN